MKKICIVIASRANYGRAKYLMRAIQEHPRLHLQTVAGASTLLARFGSAVEIIQQDGFHLDAIIPYIVEGESLLTQAKSTGLGLIELSSVLANLQPEAVITVADRFETMATAIAATYMNIPLIHIQGGEVSGNIDDRVRHAITQLADYHFVASKKAYDYLVKMGQMTDTIFHFGCPAIDVLTHIDLTISNAVMAKYTGVGDPVDWEKLYVLMVQHPVTTSYGQGFQQVTQSLEALYQLQNYQKVILWPNADAGSDDAAKAIRHFRELGKAKGFHFYKNFSPEDYARVLANACCALGNSSSFIREGAFLGTPVVLVGDRQLGREHGENIQFADYQSASILPALQQQLAHGKYASNPLYGTGQASVKIADQIAALSLTGFIKRLSYA